MEDDFCQDKRIDGMLDNAAIFVDGQPCGTSLQPDIEALLRFAQPAGFGLGQKVRFLPIAFFFFCYTS